MALTGDGLGEVGVGGGDRGAAMIASHRGRLSTLL